MTNCRDMTKNLVLLMTREGARGISIDNKAPVTQVISTYYPYDSTDLE